MERLHTRADVWVVEGAVGPGRITYRNCATEEVTTAEPVKYFLARHAPGNTLTLAVLPSRYASRRTGL